MKLIKVDTNKREDTQRFIEFPFRLYSSCKQWVPPLLSEMKLVLNRTKHPFYRHSEGDFFMIESEGDILGRIAVLQNMNYCAHHVTQTGFFYYFETVDDRSVSQALIDACLDWARKRDLTELMGPKGFLRSNGQGMLVEGFEYPPAMGMLYNFDYYPRHLDMLGFEKETDHLSGFMQQEVIFPERFHEAAEKVKKQTGLWIKRFTNRAEMRAMISQVEQVHQEAFQHNPGFYPSTREEFELIADTFIQLADPEIIKVIMKDEEIAGFILAYANISRALQAVKGRLYPFGWLRVLLEKKRTRVVDLNGIGILPKFQGRGANLLLYSELEKTLRQSKFEHGELVAVDERNFRSKSDMENLGVTWHKRHRTYRYSLLSTNL